jgi:hypothetical protein
VSRTLAEEVVPAVRELDRSGRPWDNGYNLPDRPDDVVELHPYFLNALKKGKDFHHSDLMRQPAGRRATAQDYPYAGFNFLLQPHPTAHAAINNEYGFCWAFPDGRPAGASRKIYEALLGENPEPAEVLKTQAYVLALETEYFRAYRTFAGVQFFTMLSNNTPDASTACPLADFANLRVEPRFADYLREAFKPLGVFLNFMRDTLPAGQRYGFACMLVNDLPRRVTGDLELRLHQADERGEVLCRAAKPFLLPAWGSHTLFLELAIPQQSGPAILVAEAQVRDQQLEPTRSRREVRLCRESPEQALPPTARADAAEDDPFN